ncbi:EF-hand domain-containing protein [Mycoplana dimorpha]|uniref:EF hand domain-containing protein n=1 Tax=Mycoplana dimorpha TaxID=28320 RepID=A0A2T5BJ15_MYCDI|nr:EF-hand domain-containing protein [Mycoplana dimorpha]PTM98952.1 EF hand domain-containing protein [Mycoplana dimorpha]
MASARLAGVAMVATLLSAGSAHLALAQTDENAEQGGDQQQMQDNMPGMMGGRQHGMMGRMAMRGQMMKIMFAIADTNGDGALSFDEVMAVHKRIFDAIDANKDGKVTLEEMQMFLQGP